MAGQDGPAIKQTPAMAAGRWACGTHLDPTEIVRLADS